LKEKVKSPDWWILVIVAVLMGIGIIMVFSSSQYFAQDAPYNDNLYFLKKQARNAAIGLAMMFVMYRMNYKLYKKFAWPVAIIVGIVLIVLLAGGQQEIKGTTRWLEVSGVGTFQPSEFAKLAMVIVLAKVMSSRPKRIKTFQGGFIPSIVIIGLFCGLVFAQKALSTTMIIAGTGFLMMFCAGINWRYLAGTLTLAITGVAAAIIYEPFRLQRIYAYLDPWKDPLGSGFQTVQSLLAIGSGGLSGVGLGAGGSKWYYLPERHTDFIFSVLSEELGFIGGFFVIVLFIFLLWRGFSVAVHTPDTFASLVALGITSMIGLQAFINLGVVTGLLPVTGVTLPFISYGGTSLMVSLAAMGALLNISKYAEFKR